MAGKHKTTIQVDSDLRNYLEKFKRGGESFNDVLNKKLRRRRS